MHRRTFIAGLAASPALVACSQATSDRPLPASAASTLIVLRHAERTGENLNAEGIARAAALPAALEGIPIDGIYVPDMQRNKDTAMPLAKARGLELQVIPAVDIARTMFRRQPGGTLVWVGNKDNIEALWEEVAAPGEAPLTYGQIAILPISGFRAGAVQMLTFGA